MDGIALIKALLERPLHTTAEVEKVLTKGIRPERAVKTDTPLEREIKEDSTSKRVVKMNSPRIDRRRW